ncbi:hypothetical protein LSH36_555g01005 [Paralvinella palmiformis]|uniref:Uncharacterized protein n=1 Tax=Paralvinella palmiformis TaxID=53620 RepID=A0AAD9J6I0_9ANNE|nr:hypothetical protein LSH36_555g01005 [Paralvinella palmiformis]
MQHKFVVILAILVILIFQLTLTYYYYYYYYINEFRYIDRSGMYHCCYLDSVRNRVPVIESQELVQYGRLKPGRNYAIFSASLYGSEAASYGFDLPLTAMAWKRIGFGSVLIIVGDPRLRVRHPWVRYLMDALVDKENIVVVVLKTASPSQATSISQVSRLFAASLLRYNTSDVRIQDTYLLTADADIWPIAKDFLVLPPGKDIIHGDIGNRRVDNLDVIHVPLSYVGMRIRTWRSVMTQSGLVPMPSTISEMVAYFGDKYFLNVTYDGPGWYSDQIMISLRLHQWKQANGQSGAVHVYRRRFEEDRIDRANWPRFQPRIEGVVDSHVLHHGYHPQEWLRLRQLLTKMCPDYDSVKWFDQYADQFNKLVASF